MEDIEETNTPLTKPKKPRSEKQIEAFKIAMQKRAESIAKKKEDQIYQSAKLLIEKQQKEELVEDSESEPEPEPLRFATAKTSEPIKKSKSKKQIEIKHLRYATSKTSEPKYKPKKKIIIESESETDTSESESETDTSDSEPEFIIKSRSKKKTKPKKISEQNTRVKRSEPLHNHPAKSNTDYNVYFV